MSGAGWGGGHVYGRAVANTGTYSRLRNIREQGDRHGCAAVDSNGEKHMGTEEATRGAGTGYGRGGVSDRQHCAPLDGGGQIKDISGRERVTSETAAVADNVGDRAKGPRCVLRVDKVGDRQI